MILGIDAGSTLCKLVWLHDGKVVKRSLLSTQPAMEDRLRELIAGAPYAQVVRATGYGRHSLVEAGIATEALTEIRAQAAGVSYLFPHVSTVLDLGGQDFKVIKVVEGRVGDFEMNDRCAAGTGRFIEMAAGRLNLSLEEMDSLASRASEGVSLSTMCAVFAESELVSLMAKGVPVDQMARGIFLSIAKRMVAMVKRVGGRPPFVFTGGGATMKTLVSVVSHLLGCPVEVPAHPLFTAALGAAVAR